jgi:hypothetical protein
LNVHLTASEALFRTDFLAYRTALVQFRQERESTATGSEEMPE